MKTSYAIDLFGSIKNLAAALGITIHAIYQWGDEVPELRVYQLRDLRPDVFRPELADKKAA